MFTSETAIPILSSPTEYTRLIFSQDGYLYEGDELGEIFSFLDYKTIFQSVVLCCKHFYKLVKTKTNVCINGGSALFIPNSLRYRVTEANLQGVSQLDNMLLYNRTKINLSLFPGLTNVNFGQSLSHKEILPKVRINCHTFPNLNTIRVDFSWVQCIDEELHGKVTHAKLNEIPHSLLLFKNLKSLDCKCSDKQSAQYLKEAVEHLKIERLVIRDLSGNLNMTQLFHAIEQSTSINSLVVYMEYWNFCEALVQLVSECKKLKSLYVPELKEQYMKFITKSINLSSLRLDKGVGKECEWKSTPVVPNLAYVKCREIRLKHKGFVHYLLKHQHSLTRLKIHFCEHAVIPALCTFLKKSRLQFFSIHMDTEVDDLLKLLEAIAHNKHLKRCTILRSASRKKAKKARNDCKIPENVSKFENLLIKILTSCDHLEEFHIKVSKSTIIKPPLPNPSVDRIKQAILKSSVNDFLLQPLSDASKDFFEKTIKNCLFGKQMKILFNKSSVFIASKKRKNISTQCNIAKKQKLSQLLESQ